jgi:hypothetical protein
VLIIIPIALAAIVIDSSKRAGFIFITTDCLGCTALYVNSSGFDDSRFDDSCFNSSELDTVDGAKAARAAWLAKMAKNFMI